MIQEYLFCGDEYRNEIEQFTLNSCTKEIQGIKNSECWIVTFSMKGENENSAKVLSSVHEIMVKTFQPTVLSDGSAAYYNKALYSHFNEFERKLRKLLYLKSALAKRSEKKLIEEQEELIKKLEEKNLGEIFSKFFIDKDFRENAKNMISGGNGIFSKAEMVAAIQDLPEITVWDKLFKGKAVPRLRSDFQELKAFRNDVMHAHSMNTSKYKKACKLVKEVNKQLDEAIDKVIRGKVKNETEFNIVLRKALETMDNITKSPAFQAYESAMNLFASETYLKIQKWCTSPGFQELQRIMQLVSTYCPASSKTVQREDEIATKTQDEEDEIQDETDENKNT